MAAARDSIDAVLRDRGLRRTTPEVTGESLLLGARASVALERTLSGRQEYDEAGALRLSTELLGLVPVWRRTPLQALARMHTVVAAGTVDEALLGRPRQGAERIGDLARRLTAPTSAPGMVTAAVVHAEIAVAQPFAGHNGVVARAAERLVMVERAVDPASVTVPEAGHQAMGAAYRQTLAAYRQGVPGATLRWLLHCADAYVIGAEASPVARRQG